MDTCLLSSNPRPKYDSGLDVCRLCAIGQPHHPGKPPCPLWPRGRDLTELYKENIGS